MSRFITPPDLPVLENQAILLVDFSYDDIEQVAMHCKEDENDYDIMLYSPDEHSRDWLDWAFIHCDKCVVNLKYTMNTMIKAQMIVMPKTLYVGELDFIPNRRIRSPIEIFKKTK